MKNKIIAAFAALVMTFSFSACSGFGDEPEPTAPTETVTETAEPEPAPTVTITPEPEPSEEPEATELPQEQVDEIYLGVVRDEYPELENAPDAQLIEIPKAACEDLDNGASIEDLFSVILENTTSEAEAQQVAFMVGAGIPAYCPQHMDKLENLDSPSTI